MDSPELHPETRLIAGGRPSTVGAPLNTAIEVTSAFVSDGQSPYARVDGTATLHAYEAVLGALEDADAVAFASGMAAVAAVFSLVPPSGSVVIPADCYQGVTAMAAEGEAAGRWSVQHLATDDTTAWVTAAADADLIWFETPSNPLLVVGDLQTVAVAPRRPGSVLAVDNTFATPLNQRPLDLGADITMQSVTKLLGGHSDLLGGVAATRSDDLAARLRHHAVLHGATPGALEAYLATRGMRTLALRLERGQRSAAILAERLQAHPAVTVVRYPGLADHPGHELAAAQLAGFGTMLSFDLADGETAAKACDRIRLIRHATSLGSVESTMERRAQIPGQEHLPAGLIRLSVGIEHVDDLWRDLAQALD